MPERAYELTFAFSAFMYRERFFFAEHLDQGGQHQVRGAR